MVMDMAQSKMIPINEVRQTIIRLVTIVELNKLEGTTTKIDEKSGEEIG